MSYTDQANRDLDNLKNPVQWFDLVAFAYYTRGQLMAKIPVEWGRARFEVFLDKIRNEERERAAEIIEALSSKIEAGSGRNGRADILKDVVSAKTQILSSNPTPQ